MSAPDASEQTIFDAAIEMKDEQVREAYLDSACAGHPELRERIERLLKASSRADQFLAANPLERDPGHASSGPSLPPEGPGTVIDKYKLLEKLGEGGFGIVYMAEQREPIKRRVALKIIKIGMDTREVVARFEAERQALAVLDHPNIAKVHEAGATASGRPYFVMELVRGAKITDFCDEKNLPTRERLDLFIQVCQAVQHAHQKGIIHRDLKPANILVAVNDGVAVPKIIDFGIAKATQMELTEKTVFTRFHQFIGTPAYVSPEQAEVTNVDVDTRSDIYSLGVLLYELLTGKTPFDAKELVQSGLDEMRRTIREKEPARPSTRLGTLGAEELTTTAKRRGLDAPKLISQLRGDLDWIVMKCLEKERARRYESAAGLASDLGRHINNEPVEASPPSAAYRFQKLVRRNKSAFVAASAVALSLIAGTVASTSMFLQERAAKRDQVFLRQQAQASEKRAQTEAAKSDQVAQFLKQALRSVGPSVALGRDTVLLREVLDKTAERIGKDLTNQPEVEAELRRTLGQVYFELTDYEKAEAMEQRAVALWRDVPGDHTLETAFALGDMSDTLVQRGKLSEAETATRESLDAVVKKLGEEHVEVARAIFKLAHLLHVQGKLAQAEVQYRRALAMREKLLDPKHPDLAATIADLALVLRDQGKFADAEPLYLRALAIQRETLGESATVATTMNNLGVLLMDRGETVRATPYLQQALDIGRKHLDRDHSDITRGLNNLAKVYLQQDRLAEAEELFRDVLKRAQKKYGARHTIVALALNNLGTTLWKENKLADAEPFLRDALAIQQEMVAGNNPGMATLLSNLANVVRDRGNLVEAEDLKRKSFEMWRALSPVHPNVTVLLGDLVDAQLRQRKFDESDQLSHQWLTPTNEASAQGAALLMVRSEWLARRSRFSEAAGLVSKAIALKPKSDAYKHTALMLALAQQDTKGYQNQLQQALASFTATNEPGSAARMAMDCLVLPGPSLDLTTLARLAEAALAAGTNSYFLPQFQLCQALSEYRQKRFTSAADWAAKPLASSGHQWDARLYLQANAVLALAEWQLGHLDQARAALAKAVELSRSKMPRSDSGDLGPDWGDWLMAQTLLCEAKDVIERKSE